MSAAMKSASALTPFIASSLLAIARLDAAGNVLECNSSLRELIKLKYPEAGWAFTDILTEESRSFFKTLIERIAGGQQPEKAD